MKLNMHIITDELHISKNNVYLDEKIDLILKRFQGFIPNTELSNDIVYILKSATAAKHLRKLYNLNLIIMNSADPSLFKTLHAQGCNIIHITDMSYSDIFNTLLLIFEKYNEWNQCFLEACMKYERREFQKIIDIIERVYQNPFFFLDSSQTLIAIGGKAPEEIKGTIWEFVLPHGYFSYKEFSNLKYAFKYQDSSTNYDVKWFRREEYEYAFLYAPISINGILYGDITVVDSNLPLSCGQLSLLSYTKQILELYFCQVTMRPLSESDSAGIFISLINGRSIDEFQLQYLLNRSFWKSSDSYYVMCFVRRGNGFTSLTISQNAAGIKQLFSKGILISNNGYIIVISRDKDVSQSSLGKDKNLISAFKNLNVFCGVSQVFNDIKNLYFYYQQSKFAADYLNSSETKVPIGYFYDHYFQYILSNSTPNFDLNIACDPRVLILKNHDEQNGTSLLQTLKIYLKSGCNLQKTAKNLYIHRNTLANRMDKISEISEIFSNINETEEIDQLLISCLLLTEKLDNKNLY